MKSQQKCGWGLWCSVLMVCRRMSGSWYVEGTTVIWNVRKHSSSNVVWHPRREESSITPQWKPHTQKSVLSRQLLNNCGIKKWLGMWMWTEHIMILVPVVCHPHVVHNLSCVFASHCVFSLLLPCSFVLLVGVLVLPFLARCVLLLLTSRLLIWCACPVWVVLCAPGLGVLLCVPQLRPFWTECKPLMFLPSRMNSLG